MKRIAIYGAGGLGKEVRGMIDFMPDRYTFIGYFDDFKEVKERVSEDRFDDVLMAIADPHTRYAKVATWSKKRVPFAPFVSADVPIHPTVFIGKGAIICPGTKLTVDIRLGEFAIINLNVTIGHDSVIGNYCSLMPAVNISGSVTLGDRVFVGTGATILQGITIGDDAIIGAGAVVTHDVAPGKTVVGIPAKEKTL